MVNSSNVLLLCIENGNKTILVNISSIYDYYCLQITLIKK